MTATTTSRVPLTSCGEYARRRGDKSDHDGAGSRSIPPRCAGAEPRGANGGSDGGWPGVVPRGRCESARSRARYSLSPHLASGPTETTRKNTTTATKTSNIILLRSAERIEGRIGPVQMLLRLGMATRGASQPASQPASQRILGVAPVSARLVFKEPGRVWKVRIAIGSGRVVAASGPDLGPATHPRSELADGPGSCYSYPYS
jgi:hypothetical protein